MIEPVFRGIVIAVETRKELVFLQYQMFSPFHAKMSSIPWKV